MDPTLSTETLALVKSIEKIAATRSRLARAEYAAAMKELRKSYEATQRSLASKEREKLKEIERWRVTSVAAVDPSAPVRLSDIRSVQKETVDGVKVSVPFVRSIDGAPKTGREGQ